MSEIYKQIYKHYSDCAIHGDDAKPAEECDCGGRSMDDDDRAYEAWRDDIFGEGVIPENDANLHGAFTAGYWAGWAAPRWED